MTPEQELDLKMAEPLADDNVIHFKVAFPGSPKTYSYAGLKVAGLWYITGSDAKQGRKWEDLIDELKRKNATVTSIRRATDWETL